MKQSLLMTMDITEKRKIAVRAWNWGAQPVKFVRDYLRDDIYNFGDSSMDEARLKSHYILLSYGFEMILKSRIVMLSTAQDKDALNTELQQLGHNFVKISETLKQEELKNIGIKEEIALKTDICNDGYRYFVVKTIDGRQIRIENFTDVRYRRMRYIAKHKTIVEYATAILDIWKKVETANNNTR